MNSLLQVGIVLTAMDKMSGVLTGAADKAAQGFARLQQRVVRVGQAMTEMGTKASLMGHGIIQALETPISAAANLDEALTDFSVSAMNNLGQVPAIIEEINKQAVELGNKLPGTTSDFTKAATALKENGVSLETVAKGGLKAASYMAVILKQSPAYASEMVAKLREAFGLADDELVKMTDLTQKAKFAFGLNADDIKYAAAYMGGKLNELHMTGAKNAEMLLAFQGYAQQGGIGSSQFGTNMAMFITRMTTLGQRLRKHSPEMREVHALLHKLGVKLEVFDKKGKFLGLENLFEQMKKLKGLTDAQRSFVFNKLFGEEGEKIGALMMKMNEEGGIQKQIEKLREQADLMQRIDAITQSVKNTWEAFTGSLTNFWAAVGDPMVKFLLPYVNQLNDLVGGPLMAWVDRNKDLVKWLGLAALGTGVLLVALGGLGIVAGAVASGLAVVFTPATLVVAAIAAGALLILRYWKPIKAFFVGFWKGFKEGLAPIQPAIDWLRGAFDKVTEKAKAFWNWLSPSKYSAKQIYGIQKFGQGFGKAFGDAFEKVMQFGQDAFAKLGEWFKPVEPIFQRAKTLFLDLAEGIGKFWGVLKDFGAGFAGGFWDGLKDGFQELKPILDEMGSHVVPALQAVGEAAKAFLNYGLTMGEKVWGVIKSILGGFDTGQEKTASFGRTVAKFSADMVIGMAKISLKLGSIFVDLAADMVTAGAKIMTGLLDGMKSMYGTILDSVGWIAGAIMDHFPRSPAKTGPFRDIPRIHIVESIAATIRPAPLVNAMRAAAAAGMLALSSPALAASHSDIGLARSSGPAPISINYTVNVQGGGLTDKNSIMAALKANEHELVRLIQDVMARNARKDY